MWVTVSAREESILNSEWQPVSSTVAFFDVDDTLMRGFTIASYVHFVKGELEDDDLVTAMLELERLAPTYPDRQTLVTDFFGLVAGQSWAQLSAWGRQWYEHVGRGLLVPEVVERLAEHRRRGDMIVFVSGSWLPCLLPVALDLGVEYVYCCDIEVAAGVVTGKTLTVMVGAEKADTVRDFAARHQIDLTACYAYGDDVSDAEMLSLVGHPVAVHPSPALAEMAAASGWEVLPPV